jgi:hypothetical protein
MASAVDRAIATMQRGARKHRCRWKILNSGMIFVPAMSPLRDLNIGVIVLINLSRALGAQETWSAEYINGFDHPSRRNSILGWKSLFGLQKKDRLYGIITLASEGRREFRSAESNGCACNAFPTPVNGNLLIRQRNNDDNMARGRIVLT